VFERVRDRIWDRGSSREYEKDRDGQFERDRETERENFRQTKIERETESDIIYAFAGPPAAASPQNLYKSIYKAFLNLNIEEVEDEKVIERIKSHDLSNDLW